MPGFVAAMVVELRVPAAQSLKQRRAAVRPLIDRARHRLPVSLCESESEGWQTVELTASVAAASESGADGVLDALERLIWSSPEIEVVSCYRRWTDLER